MGQILIRNVKESVLARLKQRASAQGLSLEESLRRALDELARPSREELIAESRRIRAMSPRIGKKPFAEDLIREDRDRR